MNDNLLKIILVDLYVQKMYECGTYTCEIDWQSRELAVAGEGHG